jgi:tRNA-dihydrouridine synthase B
MTATIDFSPDRPWLAPLAGFSDLPFRLLCRRYGCTVACTEMVSAKGLVYGGQGTADLLATSPEDVPLVVQLFGAEPAYVGRAMEILLEQGVRYFDLNCGCSVRKVTKTGSGAALLRSPAALEEIVRTMVRIGGPDRVGVKIRLGWAGPDPIHVELGKRLEQTGAAWVTLHPRFARQGFSGRADRARLSELKQAVSIPVIGSGDLFTAKDGVDCLNATGIDTIMYARGALNDPAVFARHTALRDGTSDVPARGDRAHLTSMIRALAKLCRTYGNEKTSLLKMRTVVPRFVRETPGVRTLRRHLTSCKTWEHFEEIISLLEHGKLQP